MAHKLAISKIEDVTHDVRQFTFEKPAGFEFAPGQAAEVGIDRDGWRDAGNPFTFTALPGWDELQFTIKIYPEHDGLTEQIGTLKVGDSFIVGEPWGTIEYKGKGTFIAGGAGVTPFIAILRMLRERGELSGHRLIFANKREEDIILRDEFDAMPVWKRSMCSAKRTRAASSTASSTRRCLNGWLATPRSTSMSAVPIR